MDKLLVDILGKKKEKLLEEHKKYKKPKEGILPDPLDLEELEIPLIHDPGDRDRYFTDPYQ